MNQRAIGRRMTTGEFRAAPDISASTAQFRAFAEDKSEAARVLGRRRAGSQPGEDRHPHRWRDRGPRDHRDPRRNAGLAGSSRDPQSACRRAVVRDGMFVLAVMTDGPDTAIAAQPPGGGPEPDEERHKLTALEGLAALSLDALSSVAYGPQAIIIVWPPPASRRCTTPCRSRSRSCCCWPCW